MESLAALASFIFVASITPGPNNLMLASSGIGFGLKRTVPHLAGVCVGFVLLLAVCGLGIGGLLMQSPALATVLKSAGSGYLLYLAWMLRGRFSAGTGGERSRPMSFAAAVAFQFANPKAWLIALTAASAFLPGLGTGWAALAALCLVACTVNLPCITSWALLGSTIRARLTDRRWQRGFAALMMGLTLYAAAAIWV